MLTEVSLTSSEEVVPRVTPSSFRRRTQWPQWDDSGWQRHLKGKQWAKRPCGCLGKAGKAERDWAARNDLGRVGGQGLRGAPMPRLVRIYLLQDFILPVPIGLSHTRVPADLRSGLATLL